MTDRYAHILLSGLLAVLAGPSLAAAPEAPELKPVVVGDVSYLVGGVGDHEELAMQGLAHDYPLLLAFTEKETGNYIAGVQVTLKDRGGRTPVDVKSDGPCFFARLKPGQYSLQANYQGRIQTRSVAVKEHGQTAMVLRWDAPIGAKGSAEPAEAQHLARGCWR